jgi:hypothetical protein
MAQRNLLNTKSEKLTPWQIFTNNGHFNSALPPGRRNVQQRICQTAKDRR